MRTRQQRQVALAIVLCLAGMIALELAASLPHGERHAPRRTVAVVTSVAPHANVRVAASHRELLPARIAAAAPIIDRLPASAIAGTDHDEATLRERLARLTILRI